MQTTTLSLLDLDTVVGAGEAGTLYEEGVLGTGMADGAAMVVLRVVGTAAAARRSWRVSRRFVVRGERGMGASMAFTILRRGPGDGEETSVRMRGMTRSSSLSEETSPEWSRTERDCERGRLPSEPLRFGVPMKGDVGCGRAIGRPMENVW